MKNIVNICWILYIEFFITIILRLTDSLYSKNMEQTDDPSSVPAGLLENMVIDSGAIIKGCGFDFHKVAKRFWTVQEVLAEIRDSKSLHLLETLPFELEVRTPSETAMKAVADFARKTNDFAALSLTDLKLIALTYQFELEANGTKYIRTEPASLMKAKVASPVSFIVH